MLTSHWIFHIIQIFHPSVFLYNNVMDFCVEMKPSILTWRKGVFRMDGRNRSAFSTYLYESRCEAGGDYFCCDIFPLLIKRSEQTWGVRWDSMCEFIPHIMFKVKQGISNSVFDWRMCVCLRRFILVTNRCVLRCEGTSQNPYKHTGCETPDGWNKHTQRTTQGPSKHNLLSNS